MGTLIRWLTLGALLVFAYMALTSPAAQSHPGLRGLLERIRFVARRARLVALIYIAVLVISAALRYYGWGLD
ncbi:MAG: hypothetical protein WCI61_11250 [Chloroflexota bacterium]